MLMILYTATCLWFIPVDEATGGIKSVVSYLILYYYILRAAHSKLQVLYVPRDYRSEGASGSEWNEVTVRSSTEVLFQLQDSAKVQKIKLSSIMSMLLSP
ncbi:hypothetical protein Tco_1519461 [Tanacetum coccineum]